MTGRQGRAEFLPASSRKAVPWKNGGGLTREIAVAPAGADLAHFDWRVSTAQVRSAGAFSSFPGIDRHLCVLAGELRLSVAGGADVWLSAQSAPLEFPGDVLAHAEPRGTEVTDLNVMVRRGRFAARLTRGRVGDGARLTLGTATALIFALADLTVDAGGVAYRLACWDALRLAGPERCALSAAAHAAFYLIEITPRGRQTADDS